MTIIVEDGTIVTGANSYVSVAELEAYGDIRSVVFVQDTESLLIQAMDYIETLKYKGVKFTYDQGLQWPRADVYIDGYYNDVNNIPKELKNGLMQTAVAIDQGNGPQQTTPRKTVREKVGELEVQYAEGSSSVTIDPKINAYLYKLLAAGGPGSANTVGNKG